MTRILAWRAHGWWYAETGEVGYHGRGCARAWLDAVNAAIKDLGTKGGTS